MIGGVHAARRASPRREGEDGSGEKDQACLSSHAASKWHCDVVVQTRLDQILGCGARRMVDEQTELTAIAVVPLAWNLVCQQHMHSDSECRRHFVSKGSTGCAARPRAYHTRTRETDRLRNSSALISIPFRDRSWGWKPVRAYG